MYSPHVAPPVVDVVDVVDVLPLVPPPPPDSVAPVVPDALPPSVADVPPLCESDIDPDMSVVFVCESLIDPPPVVVESLSLALPVTAVPLPVPPFPSELPIDIDPDDPSSPPQPKSNAPDNTHTRRPCIRLGDPRPPGLSKRAFERAHPRCLQRHRRVVDLCRRLPYRPHARSIPRLTSHPTP